MAKIAFNKLGLAKVFPVETFVWNEQTIEVKQFLPMEEKLDLISNIINDSVDENNYYNPCRIDVYKKVLILESYTNISFTEKQKENVCKLYDMTYNNGLYEEVCKLIDEKDLRWIDQAVDETVKSIYAYKNSFLGVLDVIKTDYSNMELDAMKIQEMFGEENLELLKNVMNKLG